jgi:hypothetical protein
MDLDTSTGISPIGTLPASGFSIFVGSKNIVSDSSTVTLDAKLLRYSSLAPAIDT